MKNYPGIDHFCQPMQSEDQKTVRLGQLLSAVKHIHKNASVGRRDNALPPSSYTPCSLFVHKPLHTELYTSMYYCATSQSCQCTTERSASNECQVNSNYL